MQKIHQLPPSLVSKIAAGQVIERPAFAVKELVENAIDAHAEEISVHIENAGLKKIQVIDNGEGMSKEDLIESIKPHTTSKIKSDDDLLDIKSFGFRGEALTSIAAVSKLKIKSRTPETAVGTELVAAHGKDIRIAPVGIPIGTVVTSEDIFAHIPARKKFLKSPSTELRHSIDVVSTYAIAYPSLRFLLKHNKRVLFTLPKAESRQDRIKALFGADFLSPFLPLKIQESYVSLSGFFTTPQMTTTSQSKQYIFVNNRRITDPLIQLAIKEAYGTLVDAHAHPLFFLFLDVPHELVDINVHPRKEQVSFINHQLIFQTVKEAVSELLKTHNLTFHNLSWKKSGIGLTTSYAADILKDTVLNTKSETIAQFHRCYLVTQTTQGILFFDQHAAHERILFEKLMKAFTAQAKKREYMALPSLVTFQLSAQDQELMRQQKKVLEKLGFRFTVKNSSVHITHMPLLFHDRDPKKLLTVLLDDLVQDVPVHDVDKVSKKMIMFLACRAAVKCGDILTESQMKTIIEDLEQTPNNITCPHGRPTKIFFSLPELHRFFKR